VAVTLVLRRSLAGYVADPDAFYHMAHAARYGSGSPFDTAFPWARFSVIGDFGADLWWGYHMLLAPFTKVLPFPESMGWAAVAGTSALLLTVLYVARAHRVRAPLFWVLFFLAAVPNALFRHLMMRPHVLSLAASLLLASALSRNRWRLALGASALLTWVHASLFWVPLAVLSAYCVALLGERRVTAGSEAGSGSEVFRARVTMSAGHVLAGTLLGWILRPHPVATARLVNTQIFELLRLRGVDVTLNPGGELLPLPVQGLVPVAWLVGVPWLIAVTVSLWALARPRARVLEARSQERVLLWTCMALSAGFLILTVAVASRALVEWTAFASLGVALAWSHFLGGRQLRLAATALLAAVALAATPWIAQWHGLNVRLNTLPPNHLREVSEWLATQGNEGDLVFHVHWDSFGPLFAWNQRNHYVGGMDPVFQLAHDADLHQRTLSLRGEAPPREDPWEIIARGYDARWVLVEPFRDPGLYRSLREDARFDLVRLTRMEAVFEVIERP
jgi:hypothetical protein